MLSKVNLVKKIFFRQFKQEKGVDLTTVLKNTIVMQAESFYGGIKLVRGGYGYQK